MSKAIAVTAQPIKALTANESARLEQLHGIVIENIQSYLKVGRALAEIRDRELHRTRDGRTFEQYCKLVFDIARGTAYRYIAAAEVVSNVSKLDTDGDIIVMVPANEAQVRPLTQLKPDQQRAVWQAAVETAPGRRVTASHVAKVVKDFLGAEATSKTRSAREPEEADRQVDPKYQASFRSFAKQIEVARESGYTTTSLAQVAAHLDALRAIVAEDGAAGESIPLMSDDRHKLLVAGFHLFRTDQSSMNIKEYVGSAWRKHSGPFESLAAMEREFKTLLQAPLNVRG